MAGFGAFLGGLSGGTIGASIVSLVLDDRRFQSGLAQAQGKLTASNSTMTKSVSSFASFAGPAFLAVGAAAVAFAAKAVSAASDEEEALNKVKVILGESSTAVEEFAETSAESLGIAKGEALAAAGGFAGLFKGAGLAKDAAADMSVQMVQLAGDMASFNNLATSDALEKLKAGLSGEAEPLRAVNVFLNEAAVKAEAYASGIAEVGSELTDSQKIQARYNIILKQTKDQQGDFARTSDGVANQQRILQAKITDTAAAIGKSLLPVFGLLLDLVLVVVDALKPLIDLLADLSDAIADLGDNPIIFDLLTTFGDQAVATGEDVGRLTDKFHELSDAIKTGKLPTEEAQAAIKKYADTLGPGLIELTDEYIDTLGVVGDRQDFFTHSIELTSAAIRERVPEATRKAAGGLRRLATAAGESQKDFRDAVKESGNFVEARWEELIGKSKVTATQIIKNFQKALEAQANFRQNTKTFADKVKAEFGRIPPAAQEMIADLAQRGPEGAAIMAGLAGATRDQIRTILSQWRQGKEGPASYMRVLETLGTKLNNFDGRTYTATLKLNLDVDPRIPGGLIDEALAKMLIRGQTPD